MDSALHWILQAADNYISLYNCNLSKHFFCIVILIERLHLSLATLFMSKPRTRDRVTRVCQIIIL